MFLKVFAILSVVVLPILGQYIHAGECANVEVMQNFDLKKYLGKWFEIKRYDGLLQRGVTCSQEVYSMKDETTVHIEHSWFKYGNPESTTGSAVLFDPTADPLVGKLSVAFNNQRPGGIANYWILDTDYENYSILWQCRKTPMGKSAEIAWILSRTPILNADVEEKVKAIVEKYLYPGLFRKVIQYADTCGYY